MSGSLAMLMLILVLFTNKKRKDCYKGWEKHTNPFAWQILAWICQLQLVKGIAVQAALTSMPFQSTSRALEYTGWM